MLVYVCSGGIWITQEGERSDRFVAAGGCLRISASGLTLVSALGRSTIALTSPYETGFARRIDLVRAGTGEIQPLFAAPGRFAA
jgi:hypothetical protein